ncbi:MAG: hypothetical protein Q9195_006365 [Heterodermia aff. obscurata]
MEKFRVVYRISPDEITAGENGLQKLAEQSTRQVSIARTKLLERRRGRNFFKRSGNSLQRFASSLSQFLNAYPGLSDISKGADAQYGSLISGSLLLLFRIAEFRFWQAIRRPPKTGIDKKVDEIKSATTEVISEGDAKHVKSSAEQEQIWKEQRNQRSKDRLFQIEAEFGIKWASVSPETFIAQCRMLHANAFAEAVRRKNNKKLQQISIELLEELGLYQPWNQATGSSVLILTGYNFDMYETGLYLCWLSPFTTSLADMHLSNQALGSRDRVLFFSACRDEPSRFQKRTEHPNLDQLLISLILQMLHWDNFLEEHGHFVEGRMSGGTRERIEMLKALLRVCKSSDKLYIIIDRIDGIRPSGDDDESWEDSVGRNLGLILEIADTAACTVRMVVVADASGWSKVRTETDMEGRWKIWKRQIGLNNFSMVCKVGWNQAEIIHAQGTTGRRVSL